MLNMVNGNKLLPINIGKMTENDEILFVFKFREHYILGNNEL